MKNNNNQHQQGSLNRGQRVRISITSTGMKVSEFCLKADIPESTVWSWISERCPLSLKGAMRLSRSLSTCNILCTPEWLLSGQGPLPNFLNSPKELIYEVLDSDLNHELSMFREIEFFKSLSPRYIVTGIRDNSMLPFYTQGDFVGGYKLDPPHCSKAINANCIVETSEGLCLVRKFNKGHKKGLYNLSATNLLSKAKNMVLVDVTIKEVSIIVWHRKKNI